MRKVKFSVCRVLHNVDDLNEHIVCGLVVLWTGWMDIVHIIIIVIKKTQHRCKRSWKSMKDRQPNKTVRFQRVVLFNGMKSWLKSWLVGGWRGAGRVRGARGRRLSLAAGAEAERSAHRLLYHGPVPVRARVCVAMTSTPPHPDSPKDNDDDSPKNLWVPLDLRQFRGYLVT